MKRSRNRSLRRGGLWAAIVLTLVSCGDATSDASQPDNRPACGVLADTSISAHEARLYGRYTSTVTKMLEYCSERQGTFYADTLNNNSQASRPEPISESLVPEGLRGNEQYDEPLRADLIRSVSRRFDGLVRRGTATEGGTDICGALVSLASALPDKANRPRVILILTDALQAASGVDLATATLDDAAISMILRDLRAQRLVPNLRGSKVYMVGVGVGGEQLTPAQLAQIRRFWEQYFEATKATLVTYSKTLTDFP